MIERTTEAIKRGWWKRSLASEFSYGYFKMPGGGATARQHCSPSGIAARLIKKEDDMEHVAHILIAAGYFLLVMSYLVA